MSNISNNTKSMQHLEPLASTYYKQNSAFLCLHQAFTHIFYCTEPRKTLLTQPVGSPTVSKSVSYRTGFQFKQEWDAFIFCPKAKGYQPIDSELYDNLSCTNESIMVLILNRTSREKSLLSKQFLGHERHKYLKKEYTLTLLTEIQSSHICPFIFLSSHI